MKKKSAKNVNGIEKEAAKLPRPPVLPTKVLPKKLPDPFAPITVSPPSYTGSRAYTAASPVPPAGVFDSIIHPKAPLNKGAPRLASPNDFGEMRIEKLLREREPQSFANFADPVPTNSSWLRKGLIGGGLLAGGTGLAAVGGGDFAKKMLRSGDASTKQQTVKAPPAAPATPADPTAEAQDALTNKTKEEAAAKAKANEPSFASNAINSTKDWWSQSPNWQKGLMLGGGALGAGAIANRMFGADDDEEEDADRRGKKLTPWGTIAGVGAGLGGAALGARYLTGGDYGKLLNKDFWNRSSPSSADDILSMAHLHGAQPGMSANNNNMPAPMPPALSNAPPKLGAHIPAILVPYKLKFAALGALPTIPGLDEATKALPQPDIQVPQNNDTQNPLMNIAQDPTAAPKVAPPATGLKPDGTPLPQPQSPSVTPPKPPGVMSQAGALLDQYKRQAAMGIDQYARRAPASVVANEDAVRPPTAQLAPSAAQPQAQGVAKPTPVNTVGSQPDTFGEPDKALANGQPKPEQTQQQSLLQGGNRPTHDLMREDQGVMNLASHLAKTDPAAAQEPNFWQKVQNIWAGMGQLEKGLLMAGLGLGAIGLIKSMSGGGGGRGGEGGGMDWMGPLMGVGGLGLGAYASGLFDSNSPARQTLSGNWGDAARTADKTYQHNMQFDPGAQRYQEAMSRLKPGAAPMSANVSVAIPEINQALDSVGVQPVDAKGAVTMAQKLMGKLKTPEDQQQVLAQLTPERRANLQKLITTIETDKTYGPMSSMSDDFNKFKALVGSTPATVAPPAAGGSPVPKYDAVGGESPTADSWKHIDPVALDDPDQLPISHAPGIQTSYSEFSPHDIRAGISESAALAHSKDLSTDDIKNMWRKGMPATNEEFLNSRMARRGTSPTIEQLKTETGDPERYDKGELHAKQLALRNTLQNTATWKPLISGGGLMPDVPLGLDANRNYGDPSKRVMPSGVKEGPTQGIGKDIKSPSDKLLAGQVPEKDLEYESGTYPDIQGYGGYEKYRPLTGEGATGARYKDISDSFKPNTVGSGDFNTRGQRFMSGQPTEDLQPLFDMKDPATSEQLRYLHYLNNVEGVIPKNPEQAESRLWKLMGGRTGTGVSHLFSKVFDPDSKLKARAALDSIRSDPNAGSRVNKFLANILPTAEAAASEHGGRIGNMLTEEGGVLGTEGNNIANRTMEQSSPAVKYIGRPLNAMGNWWDQYSDAVKRRWEEQKNYRR